MTRVHLDTDIGGDTDDLCALAYLLALEDVELMGVTTCMEDAGKRAGLAASALALAGRTGVPVAAGAEGSIGGYPVAPGIADVREYWPGGTTPRPGPMGEALDLLAASIEAGATVVGIGSYTNLALLEVARPGLLASSPVVLMGGWIAPLRAGLPAWGPEMDFNVQQDTVAARIVLERCDPLLVPVDVTLEVSLRDAHLPRLRAAAPLGEILALQGELHAEVNRMRELGRAHATLPDDLLNFQYDGLACAVACGWDGVEIEELALVPVMTEGVLTFRWEDGGKPTRVVRIVDGERFERHWLDVVAPDMKGEEHR